MKKQTNNIFTLILMAFTICILSSASIKKFSVEDKIYADMRKKAENIVCTYNLPIIKLSGNTTQTQTKGGVIITTEIVPFSAIRNVNQDKTIADLYPGIQPGYDAYEITNIPYFTIYPEYIQFKIRIRNNEQVPLKLGEVGFALIVDGTNWLIRNGNSDVILTGFEKEITINGPDLNRLYTSQVMYLLLNGVPTIYDEAGNVKKKENFEWYFDCKTEEVQKTDQKTYTYEVEPIYKEICDRCNGTGSVRTDKKCTFCSGTGSITYNSGKTDVCLFCHGAGNIYVKCTNCNGQGMISYPKSKEPNGTVTVNWIGWQVKIITKPQGATVKIIDPKIKEYKNWQPSNTTVNWWSENSNSTFNSNLYPIIVEYQGQIVKVLPYNNKGKELSKIVIDFSGGSPIVKKGAKVN